jgi:hypothetical protein
MGMADDDGVIVEVVLVQEDLLGGYKARVPGSAEVDFLWQGKPETTSERPTRSTLKNKRAHKLENIHLPICKTGRRNLQRR